MGAFESNNEPDSLEIAIEITFMGLFGDSEGLEDGADETKGLELISPNPNSCVILGGIGPSGYIEYQDYLWTACA